MSVNFPKFFVLQTLLGGEPDCNRRTICSGQPRDDVMEFNKEMKPWTPEHQRRLDGALAALLAGESPEKVRAEWA